MLGRLGFAGRLMAIVLLALLAIIALGAGLEYVNESRDAPPQSRLPLPEQAAAIVEMFEGADTSRRDLILKAVNTDSLSVSVARVLPRELSSERRLPAVEWVVNQYINTLGNREVIVTVDPTENQRWRELRLGQYWVFARQPLRLAVALRPGGHLVFETRGEIARRLFGLPPGFWVGIFGALVGIAAILAVMREARPLRELSRAVTAFSGDSVPIRIRPGGAPEIRSLIAAVNDMQGRIAALIKGRTLLIGAISHDFKTYITRLRLRAEAIPEDEQRDKATADLDDMTALIDDALAVARGSAGPQRREAVDVAELIEALIADRGWPNVELNRRSVSAAPVVDADPVALRRVFTNLIENALRYGNHCWIAMETSDATLVVNVDDDGPGIPEAERQAVFEPFYRIEPSRSRVTGGSGLGLAISRQIVEGCGGTLSFETSPKKGARLRVLLPALRSDGAIRRMPPAA